MAIVARGAGPGFFTFFGFLPNKKLAILVFCIDPTQAQVMNLTLSYLSTEYIPPPPPCRWPGPCWPAQEGGPTLGGPCWPAQDPLYGEKSNVEIGGSSKFRDNRENVQKNTLK